MPDTGLARVVGHVHVTRGENQLNGAAAIVNMKTGLATMTQAPGKRVQGLVVPNGSGGDVQPPATTPRCRRRQDRKESDDRKGPAMTVEARAPPTSPESTRKPARRHRQHRP